MTPSYRVRYQLLVNTHDGEFHLFERDALWPVPPISGMLLRELPGVPNITGPDAMFDNIVRRVVLSGPGKDKNDGKQLATDIVPLVQLQGFRAPTETLDEIRATLVGWDYISCVSDNVTETGPEDLLNG